MLACIIAAIIYFDVINSLGNEIASWQCILGALPFALLGFITYQSMNAENILIVAWRSFLLSRTDLISKPFNLYCEISKSIIEKYQEALLKDDKKLPKNQATQ